ncbi:MAG: methyltransferase [Methanosarcinales archaeon]|nr:MAG: methyltransferase [Methanosarcinales archaeon]
MTCTTQLYTSKPTAFTHSSDIHEKIIPGLGTSHDSCADTIAGEIMDIYSRVVDFDRKELYYNPSNHPKTLFQRLDQVIALDVDDTTAKAILSSSGFNSAFDAITGFRSHYTAELEIEQANAILKSSDPWQSLKNFAYFQNYIELARTEFRGARLKAGDTVLFLGSGPLPLSLIVLCREHGLKGIGIEQEPDRVELSRRVIERLGLSDQIKIIKGNHLTLPIKEPTDLIMVAAQAEPKDVIFNHLAKATPTGTKISYRIYEKGLRRLLDTFSRYELPKNLKEYQRIRPTPPANNTSVFLSVGYA